MRILVYGAGIIGSLYAGLLARAGREVTLLARGDRLSRLRDHGVELARFPGGEKTRIPVGTVEALEPHDAYDLVLVVLPRYRVREVLPVLAANRRTPSVMFMGNTAGGAGEMIAALDSERVLLGFPGAAGVREGHTIRYLICSRREQPTTIGELDGRESTRIRTIGRALGKAGFPVAICSNMDAWLKTHVAEVAPTTLALYAVGGDPARLARTRDALVLMLRAIREGYRALRRLGVPLTPGNRRLFEWLPEPLLVALMRRGAGSADAAIKLGHALEARDEWRLLAEELRALTAEAGVPAPALERLYRYRDSSLELLADRSRELRLRWSRRASL